MAPRDSRDSRLDQLCWAPPRIRVLAQFRHHQPCKNVFAGAVTAVPARASHKTHHGRPSSAQHGDQGRRPGSLRFHRSASTRSNNASMMALVVKIAQETEQPQVRRRACRRRIAWPGRRSFTQAAAAHPAAAVRLARRRFGARDTRGCNLPEAARLAGSGLNPTAKSGLADEDAAERAAAATGPPQPKRDAHPGEGQSRDRASRPRATAVAAAGRGEAPPPGEKKSRRRLR